MRTIPRAKRSKRTYLFSCQQRRITKPFARLLAGLSESIEAAAMGGGFMAAPRRLTAPARVAVGGGARLTVGINLAVADAVAAANILCAPLRKGRLDADLAKVQRRRELPTRIIQAIQVFAQNRAIAPNLNGDLSPDPRTC